MSNMEERLIYNAIQTPDGTILESRSRHDYKTYVDANGKEYMIDGGLDYMRRSANGDEKDISIWNFHPHVTIREYVVWGTYGINGDQPLRYVKLSEMETDHIQACLDNVATMYPQTRNAMENEIKYRNKLCTNQ